MFAAYDFLTALGRQAGNHLWQSTAVAGVAALIALTLENGHARARYWLWLAASLKFLVPFSILAAAGGRMGAWLSPAEPVARASAVVQQFAQPFTPVEGAAVAAGAAPASASPLPGLLLAVWLCGFLAVLFRWWVRWRRVAAMVRVARRLTAGPETEALRRLGAPTLEVVASSANLEPGVFGILRQVLWIPDGIGERLSSAELEAIVAHEISHARRRDNLAAAIHMAVEAVFWFHPVVWWLGARLTEERERACDEEVLRRCGDPRAYAEAILKVCEFYLASPVCAAGVTGGGLKKRIETIMANRFAGHLSYGTKALLASAAALVIAGPVVIGLMSPPRGRAASQPDDETTRFEAASVKAPTSFDGNGIRVKRMLSGGPGTSNPGLMQCENCPLSDLVAKAYDVEPHQISGPKALENEFLVSARVPAGATAGQARLMLRNLLAERFNLKVHWEKKDVPGYQLAVGSGGPKLRVSADTKAPAQQDQPHITVNKALFPVIPPGYPAKGILTVSNGGTLHCTAGGRATMAQLAQELTRKLGQPVVDGTGLKGEYDFNFLWISGEPRYQPGTEPPAEELPLPTLADGLRTLGLNAEARKVRTETLVVDRAANVPSEN